MLAAGLLGGHAQAADMATKAPAPAAMFNWSGFYAGLHAGYGWGDTSHTNSLAATGEFGIDGWALGGQLGYNLQSGSAVVGVEADIAWTNIEGSFVGVCVTSCNTDIEWLSTIRGRAGLAWNTYLFYATAGVAIGGVGASLIGADSSSKTQTGWTAGVGIEGIATSRWTARVEYLYVDLGDAVVYNTIPALGVVTNVDTRTHLVRVALNYKY